MNASTIIHKKPGLLVPDLMLKKASVACPSVFGFAGQEKNKLVHESLPKTIPFGELQELQTAFKDEHLILFFGNFPKAVIPDDIQPWTINGADGNAMVALFFEGNCKNYEGLNGDHTGEYCASDEIIFPRLAKAGEIADGDVDKFMEELKKPGLQKVLCSTFEDRGVYVFLPAKGEPVCFGDNKLGGEFTWGRTSNTYGYKEETSTTEKVKEVAKSSISFLRGRGTSATAAPDEAPAVEDPNEVVKPEEPDTSVPEAPPPDLIPDKKEWEAKGYKRMFPPPKLGKGKSRNLWLRTFNCINVGQLPADHESSQCAVWVQPEFIELAQRVVSSKGEVDNLATFVHKARKGEAKSNVTSTTTNVTAELAREELVGKKDEEKPITRSSVREKHVPAVSTARDVAVMSNENKEKAMTRLSGYLDSHRPRPSPLELQKAETKHANFSESTSTTFEERLFLPKEQIFDLFDGNEIATSMYLELKWRYIQDSGVKLEDLITPKSFPDQKVEPEPIKEIVPEAKKAGALSFLRGKAA